MPSLADFNRHYPETDVWLFTSFDPPDMASETIDVAIRDDVSHQAECIFEVLYKDRLYPAWPPQTAGDAGPATNNASRRTRDELGALERGRR